MTEDEAQARLREQWPAAFPQLEYFVRRLIAENAKQNLIAPSTVGEIWARHILDSAQLVPLAPSSGRWLDIGSGGGLPGLVVAILRPETIALCEPRNLRAAFLADVAADMGLSHCTIISHAAKRMSGTYDVISARAVAPVDRLLELSDHLVSRETIWLLPRGRSWQVDIDAISTKRYRFHVEPSWTDPSARIVRITQVDAA